MKRLSYIIAIVFLISCKKENNELLQNTTTGETGVTNSGLEPVPVVYKWYSMATLAVPNNDPNDHIYTIQVNGDTYCITKDALKYYKLNNTTKYWEPSEGFYPWNAFGTGQQYFFSYQSKFFFGMNRTAHGIFNNFQCYDVENGTTPSLAVFPGTPVSSPTWFVIGSKAYIMNGVLQDGTIINQFWEYNIVTDQWTNKAGSPLGSRASSTAMVVDNKAYVGLGYSHVFSNNEITKSYKNDWLLYDPATNSSTAKASFPGSKRSSARGFVIGNSPYVGFGRSTTSNSTSAYNDFYKYNPTANEWTIQSQWPSNIGNSIGSNIATFVIGNRGYLVKGSLSEFWCFSNTPIFQQQ